MGAIVQQAHGDNASVMEPGFDSSPSALLDFAHVLLAEKSLPYRLAQSLRQAVGVFQASTVMSIVKLLDVTPGFQAEIQQQLMGLVTRLDHVGLLLPCGTDETTLSLAANKEGLAISAHSPSEIFCKELGMLANLPSVDTHIFWLHGLDPKFQGIRIEAFVTQADPQLVNTWIAAGIGTHIALSIRSQDSMGKMQNILASHAEYIPTFMQQQPMVNLISGSRVLYYDLPLRANGKILRVEIHQNTRPDGDEEQFKTCSGAINGHELPMGGMM